MLDLSGTTTIDYYIHFNLAGKVTEFYATDGQYQYIYVGTDLAKQDIASTTIGSDGQTSNDAMTNSPALVCSADFAVKGATTGECHTGVITIADAMSYAQAAGKTGWSKVELKGTDATTFDVELPEQEAAS